MSGGGSGGGTTTSTNNIAPEVAPLFAQTGQLVQGIQSGMPDFSRFFGSNPQVVPGQTAGQQDIGAALRTQAFGPGLNAPQQDAYNSLTSLINSPVGSSPATQAAMAAVRTPVLNELGNAGLGNSGAVGTELGGAYAPILAQEMAQRFAAIPQLQSIGNAQYAQTQGNLQSYGASEEAGRSAEALQQQANYQDFLRQQGLGTQFSTGILSGFPSIGSTTGVTKQSGGGMSVVCTAIRRRGMMPYAVYKADDRFGKTLPRETMVGYHRWGVPLARLIDRSMVAARIAAPVTNLIAKEMARRANGWDGGFKTYFTSKLLDLGLALCGWLGRRVQWQT